MPTYIETLLARVANIESHPQLSPDEAELLADLYAELEGYELYSNPQHDRQNCPCSDCMGDSVVYDPSSVYEDRR